MRDRDEAETLAQALADIEDIRNRMAAGALFRGFGPAVIAATGGLALALASAQSLWPSVLAAGQATYFGLWIGLAGLAAALIGAEMVARSRRLHGGLADAMVLNAVEQFLPAAVAGAALAVALLGFAPDAAWALPGLWQILVALGLFASARCLPASVRMVGAWYLIAGVACLLSVDRARDLIALSAEGGGAFVPSPWAMGGPFGIGQLLLAAILHGAEGAGGEIGGRDE